MAVSLLLGTACYQPARQKSHNDSNSNAECRIIQHQSGETCVPLEPKRIIALDPEITLDPAIALGIQPVGYGAYNHKGEEVLLGVYFDEVMGAKNVGDASQPSLEKILLLKPDLILSTEQHEHKLLSEIAPTVPVPFPDYYGMPANKAFFKENLRYVAQIVGEEEKADEVLGQYQKRIAELKAIIGNRLEKAEISILFHEGNYIWTIIKDVYPAEPILADLGLSYNFALPGKGAWNLSLETILGGKYDSDILFIVDASERGLSFYTQHPIFGNLKAVKNNRAYIVSQQNWRSLGISGANKTLDDLFEYLPKAIQNL